MPNYNLKTRYTVIPSYNVGNIPKLIFFDTAQRYTYVPTYVRIHTLLYVRTYLHTNVYIPYHMYIPTYVRTPCSTVYPAVYNIFADFVKCVVKNFIM